MQRSSNDTAVPSGRNTLLAGLAVAGICAGLVALAWSARSSSLTECGVRTTVAHFQSFEVGILSFEKTNGRLPTMEEGLQALLTNPDPASLPNWRLVIKAMPRDPWGNDYRYVAPAPDGEAKWGIYSLGADGISRSMGNDRDDESSWDPEKWRERDTSKDAARVLSAIALVILVVWLLRFAGGSGKRRVVPSHAA